MVTQCGYSVIYVPPFDLEHTDWSQQTRKLVCSRAHQTLPLDVCGVLLMYGGENREQVPAVQSLQVQQGKPPGVVLEVWERVKLPKQAVLIGCAAAHQVVGFHHQQVSSEGLRGGDRVQRSDL